MRILIVTKYYHPVIGGVETLVRTLAERYVAAGHQCTVLCMDPEKDSDDVLHGVRVVRFAVPAYPEQAWFRECGGGWSRTTSRTGSTSST